MPSGSRSTGLAALRSVEPALLKVEGGAKLNVGDPASGASSADNEALDRVARRRRRGGVGGRGGQSRAGANGTPFTRLRTLG
jgi:hypothetical protein